MGFSNVQLKQLAEFSANLGIVFAVSVVSPLFSSAAATNVSILLKGLAAAIVSLTLSLYIAKGVNE